MTEPINTMHGHLFDIATVPQLSCIMLRHCIHLSSFISACSTATAVVGRSLLQDAMEKGLKLLFLDWK